MAKGQGLTTRTEDYAKWYGEVIEAGDLAEHSPVRGCMVIKPYGYALWENMRDVLDRMFKDTGHSNAYFPLFIPKSYLSKEAEHDEGFAKECAIVTHSRLIPTPDGKDLMPDPSSKLEEELIIRPTSETIIYGAIKNWIQSYRDLPLLLNQWANVVRWEMRTRLFLRTAEFLWQEGHTVHATAEEAEEETAKMLGVYADFLENWAAIPVLQGRKSESEKFAGADHTYCVEAMMQDRRALQAGTSHNLGQNFAKGFDLTYQTQEGKLEHAWTTSWGVSTRLIGGLIMTHSDDKGLVLPPKLAPHQVVVVPIWRKDAQKDDILAYADKLVAPLREKGIRVHLDARDKMQPGKKFYEWEKKGVPLRLEVGPRDMENDGVMTVRRDTGDKAPMAREAFLDGVQATLDEIQATLLAKARAFREENTHAVDSYDRLKEIVEGDGGFCRALWCGSDACENQVQSETKATIRCIPFDEPEEKGDCIICGESNEKIGKRIVWSKAY